jgi:phage gpG-like protein
MLVKKIFNKNRLTNKAYRLGDAMRDAKKVYRKTASTISTLVKSKLGKQSRRPSHRGSRRMRKGSRRMRRRRGGALGFAEYKGGDGEEHVEKLVGGEDEKQSM